MEKKAEQAYLFDFYKDLLNKNQQSIFEDFVFNDLSLGEIAQEREISRQGVHDMIRRSVKLMEDYEAKLHLVEKYLFIRDHVERIQSLSRDFSESKKEIIVKEIEQISNEILEEL
ncbi:MAG: YlxM family DNA-binding protein [Lachnospiraceae bacterium]